MNIPPAFVARVFKLILVLAVVLVPLGSCSYFKFFAYPQDVYKEAHGSYILKVEKGPADFFLQPELALGSIHNNTQLTVSLMDGQSVQTKVLVDGGDLPEVIFPCM